MADLGPDGQIRPRHIDNRSFTVLPRIGNPRTLSALTPLHPVAPCLSDPLQWPQWRTYVSRGTLASGDRRSGRGGLTDVDHDLTDSVFEEFSAGEDIDLTVRRGPRRRPR